MRPKYRAFEGLAPTVAVKFFADSLSDPLFVKELLLDPALTLEIMVDSIFTNSLVNVKRQSLFVL